MKKILTGLVAILFVAIIINGCGEPKAKTPEGWQTTDLSLVNPDFPIVLDLPKDATIESAKYSIYVKLNDTVSFTINKMPEDNKAEAMKLDKDAFVVSTDNSTAKIITDEPCGFVYSLQYNDSFDGEISQPEGYFIYYLEKEGLVYAIQLDGIYTYENINTVDHAKFLYEIVKSSASIK